MSNLLNIMPFSEEVTGLSKTFERGKAFVV